MKKLLLIILYCLLFAGCVTSPTKIRLNYRTDQSEYFRGSSFRDDNDISATVNYYLSQDTLYKQVNTIALLPADYDDEHRYDSVLYPEKKWIDLFGEYVKARMIQGYSIKNIGNVTVDTTTKWNDYVDIYSKNLRWDLIYNSLKTKHKALNQTLLDSAEILYANPELFIISPLEIDNCLDASEFYSDNMIKYEYERWGGKACYDSICDSITKMVQCMFISNGLYKIIPASISQNVCDSIYFTLDNNGRNLWRSLFDPTTTVDSSYFENTKAILYTVDEKSKNILSSTVLKRLNADAYLSVDVCYDEGTRIYSEKRSYERRSQISLNMAIIGRDRNVLWSANFPISKIIKQTAHLSTDEHIKRIYANEIIDYNMAREGVRRTLSLLRANK